MMSWQLFTPSCDRFAAWPHHHVQASSVWCIVPHPAPVFLLALTATQAPSSNPSCCLDHLQMPVLLFCLPERGRYNYPSLPCCLGAWWRHRLDMLRATRPSSCSLRLWGTLGLRFWGRVEESRQIINRNDFNPMKKMQWLKNLSPEAQWRTSPQEFNWPEMMCTCFRPDSSSLSWVPTNPRGCILHREVSVSLRGLECPKLPRR